MIESNESQSQTDKKLLLRSRMSLFANGFSFFENNHQFFMSHAFQFIIRKMVANGGLISKWRQSTSVLKQ